MKRYTKLLPIVITLGFLMLFFLPSVKGFDDIEYVFQKDSFYDNDDVNNVFNNSFNLREQTYYDLGNYPATYSFTNDGTHSAEGWSFGQDGGSVIVNSAIQGHKKVLDLRDTDNSAIVNAFNIFDDQNGILTIEWWWMTNSTPDYNWISFRDDGTHMAFFGITSDTFRYYDGGAWQNTEITATENTWYHHKVILNTDTEKLVGWYINGILELNDETFWNSIIDGIDEMHISTDSAPDNYRVFIDAIGYSWGYASEIFDFTADTIGQEPIGWISDNSGGSTTLIKASLDGRTKILELYDNGFGSIPNIYTNTTTYINENFAFEFTTNNTGEVEHYITFSENDLVIIQFHAFFDDFYYIKSGLNLIKANFITNNEFFLIEVVLNDLLGTFDIYIDDILEGSSLPYVNNITNGINRIALLGHDIHPSDPEYSCYIDNIIFDLIPSNYSVGLNIYPLINETDYLEVDKFEFAMDGINSLYSLGHHAIVSTFSANEVDGGTAEVIADESSLEKEFTNRLMDLEVVDTSDGAVIIKSNINDTSEFIEVSYDFELKTGTNNDAFMDFLVLSYPNPIADMIVKLRIDFSDMTLYLYDDEGAIIRSLKDNLVLNVNYTLELKVNYEIDVCFSYFYQESVLIDSDVFQLLSLDESGLYSVIADLRSEDDSAQVYLDNIGVYNNSLSMSTDYGWSYIEFGAIKTWNSEKNNIFDYYSNGTFHFSMTQGSFYAVGANSYVIKGLSVYNETSTIINTYGVEQNRGSPLAVFTVQGRNFKLENFSITGSYLEQDTNKYYLEFTSGGVENESYFYVDSSNNLRFTHTADQDGVNEFIQASFDITDKSSTGTVLSFLSDIDANAYGFFRVNYSTTSLVLQMETTSKTKRVLLDDGLTINSFVVLISDTNKDQIEGITEGLVSNIVLLDVESSIASVITLNLIEMIIPLIIILIPTLSISKLYGKFLIIPLFLMFSLILAITGLLPIWLFFVVLVSSALFIFFEKDKNEVF